MVESNTKLPAGQGPLSLQGTRGPANGRLQVNKPAIRRFTGEYQLYRQIQRDHVLNIFYNYLLYPGYSIGGARPHEAGTLPPMSQPS